MKVHVFSQELEVLEFEEGENPSPEEIGEMVQSDLARMGRERWSSVELEVFTYKKGTLVFARPARVFVPKFLANA